MLMTFQEIKVSQAAKFSIAGYTFVQKGGHFNQTSHEGETINIQNSVPFNETPLTTNIQAATTVHVNIDRQRLTVCSVYIPGSQDLREAELEC